MTQMKNLGRVLRSNLFLNLSGFSNLTGLKKGFPLQPLTQSSTHQKHKSQHKMDFGIGFGEIVFTLVIVLMLFGSDKVPEIARTLGKFMAKLKNATNEIKSEIQKSVDSIPESNSLSQISDEINKAKTGFLDQTSADLNQTKEDFDNITGPIKRQL